ncbi:hypothetical protein [Demequina aestuarii]|uniref:hypothetical protein n=1 Tax=Demequina aestuarii TaxID=327095 RepID=UPI00078025B4|nr:hypothetical protein [Demequina aestuarii]
MNRPSFRTIAVAAGFLGVSIVVAGTASAMVGPPADAPVASAVELRQEDPASVTAPVVADAATEAAPVVRVPVEVGSAALECDDDGVCDARHERSGAPVDPPVDDAPAPPNDTAPSHGTASSNSAAPSIASPGCDWPAKPPRHSGSEDERTRTWDAWKDAWHAAAQECGWDVGAWDREGGAWRGPADDSGRHQRDAQPAWDGDLEGRNDGEDEPRDSWKDADEPQREWGSERDAWSGHGERRDGGR